MRDDKAYRERLQAESLAMFPGTSPKAKKARKGWRNRQRLEAGFKKEGRGGLARVYDKNKNVIKPIALGAASLLTGGLAAPMALGAAMGGLDREGKGGIGFDVGGGLRGAAEGALAGKLGQVASGAMSGAAGASGAGLNPIAGAVKGAGLGVRDAFLKPILVNSATDPLEGVANANNVGQNISLGGLANTAKTFLSNPRNALGTAQALYGAYQNQQQLAQQRRATQQAEREWQANAGLRNQAREGLNPNSPAALARFNQFAEQTQPQYEASLRDANRYAAGTGRLNSGSLRTDFGNLANQRNLQLDAARQGFTDSEFERNLGLLGASSGGSPYNAQTDLGNLYGQRAGTAYDAVSRFWRNQGMQGGKNV